ncbi:hypothetical protein LEP1GSC082_2006 [Leptospira kirschneri str. H2]|uniref:Uncharacterized protein n=1 Tax=Leptospira kirschneri serovar Bulgarica str. Nikolaevo TaxID=1240687 RepID=M6F6D1_9LEPT|nr:hypothetical protein LEP1GSC082_2006 [Leptospira kirschneri str. H2]EMK23955.1 hypothetical protein LEP1GSC008_1355 [Leptospira kirschneri serovar Bulgarica str. Nikolaevo]
MILLKSFDKRVRVFEKLIFFCFLFIQIKWIRRLLFVPSKIEYL